MNRVLAYMGGGCCAACRKLRRVEETIERQKVEAERIEALFTEDEVEFWLPSAERVLRPRPDDELDGVGIRLLVSLDMDCAEIDADLRAFAIGELRRLARSVDGYADRIEAEGGVS